MHNQGPGLAARVFVLPFRPDYWRDSPAYPLVPLFLSLFALSLIAGFAKAWGETARLRGLLHRAADRFEWSADPAVFENGSFRLLGPRVFRMSEGDMTLLLDPESTVPESDIGTEEYIVIRRDKVASRLFNLRSEMSAASLVDDAAGARVVIDSSYLRWFADEIAFLALGVLYFKNVPIELVGTLCYVLIAALVLLVPRGMWLGLGYVDCVKVAMATCSTTAVVDAVFGVLGVSLPRQGLLWFALTLGLGFVALALRAADADGRPD